MELIKSKTYLNLAKSYAGECQAKVRYMFMEYGARNEGYSALAEVIDKVVYNEFNHARMFYTKLQSASKNTIDNIDIASGYPFKEKWNLVENLRLAAEEESAEVNKIYPEYAKTAEEEGFPEIAALFKRVLEVERTHMELFNTLYEQFKSGKQYKKPQAVKWKCSGCGYVYEGKEAPDECPLCMAKQGAYLLKDANGINIQ